MFLFQNRKYYQHYLIKLFQKKWLEGFPYAFSSMTAIYSLYKLFQQLFDSAFPALQNPHWTLRLVTLFLFFVAGYLWWLFKKFKSLNSTRVT